MNEIIKKNGITFGIVTGLVSVLITTLIYIIDLKLFTAWWLGVLNIIIYISIGVFLLVKTKKELHGVFPFKDAFTTYFISAVVGIIISVAFNIILFNFIDPGAKETIKELTIKFAVEMMEKFDAPKDAINQAIKDMQANDQFSIGQLLKGSVFSILFSAIFGLILAAIFKSKSPSSQGL
ncbi:DUF4199 domain-containing protein [Flavobacterium wongokense]|uniref:DUF4199 domain-containing protein n=1 Tax=Flavobacterium wongokense TaxID=2910674 RepID=UPI0021047B6A|nr:DUF4199 domain-containing protein [Flavobacterium sp. WG47]